MFLAARMSLTEVLQERLPPPGSLGLADLLQEGEVSGCGQLAFVKTQVAGGRS